MKKGTVIIIAALMAISLVGLVAMQMNWIRHDLQIREERFALQVSDALMQAVNKLETKESVQLVTTNFPWVFEDSLVEYFSEIPESVEIPEIPEDIVLENIDTHLDTVFQNHEFTYSSSISDSGQNNVRVYSSAKNGDEKVVVSINSNGINTETTKNGKKIIRVYNDQTQLAREEAIIAKEIAERERERANLRFKKIGKAMKKMAIEYERKDVTLMQRRNPETLDSLIGDELNNQGVRLPYSIALFSGPEDSIIWQRGQVTGSNVGSKEYSANLFPGDIINRNDIVKVGFNDTFTYFLSSMWLMLLSSAFFTLAIVFIFSYTLYIIFKQKKLSEIRNDFINNMTHEFKTPIATIRLASEAIANNEVIRDPDKVKFYTRIISDENDRMNSHVENILQMALFDKKAFAPDLTNVNMHDVIADAVTKFSLQVEEKGGRIDFHPGASNYTVRADARFISVIIMNLLDNAVKYSNQNPIIKIETKDSDKGLFISVEDNGIGMDNATQRRIFEKFYRVPSGNLHNIKGFGLGLSYVKAIVSAHNGTIHVHSKPGEGSKFEIVLSTHIN